jgi:hypothetical protein
MVFSTGRLETVNSRNLLTHELNPIEAVCQGDVSKFLYLRALILTR